MRKIILAVIFLLTSVMAYSVELPVHHQYVYFDAPQVGDIKNVDVHVTVNKDPDVSQMGYYYMYSFSYANGVGGYMGLQKDHTEGKKVIFSVWDHGNTQSVFPVSQWCKRFGHEGSGTQCILKFNWEAGKEYKLRVWRLNDVPGGQQWGAWVIDYATGAETLIGVMEMRNSGGQHGYGSLTTDGLVNIENYQTRPDVKFVGCEAIRDFSVTWSAPFYNNYEIVSDVAKADYHTSIGNACVQNNQAHGTINQVTQRAGIDVQHDDKANVNLWQHIDTRHYKEIDCVFNWLEKNNPAFSYAGHKHRPISKSVYGVYMRDYRLENMGYALITNALSDQLVVGDHNGTNMANAGTLEDWKRNTGCKAR